MKIQTKFIEIIQFISEFLSQGLCILFIMYRLFEMGFSEQLTEIIRRLPETRQTLLFSATLPKVLIQFAKAGLTNPVLVRYTLTY